MLAALTLAVLSRPRPSAPAPAHVDPRAGLAGTDLGRPGPLAPCILWPRHRIPSAAPRTVLSTPGHTGAVVVRWRRSQLRGEGAVRTRTTRRRRLDWPEGWRPLDAGEWLIVELRTPGGRVRAVSRHDRPALDVGLRRGDAAAARAWAERGWPLVAARVGVGTLAQGRLARWVQRADAPRARLFADRQRGGSGATGSPRAPGVRRW